MSNATVLSSPNSLRQREDDQPNGLPQRSTDGQDDPVRPILASRASQITITPSSLHIRSIKSPISPAPNLRSASVNVPDDPTLENPEGSTKQLVGDGKSEVATRAAALKGLPPKASASEKDSGAQESYPSAISSTRSPTIIGDRGNEGPIQKSKPTVLIPSAQSTYQLTAQRPHMKRQDSITSLMSTRPAPPSPASAHPSSRSAISKHESLHPLSTSRKQSLISEAATERSPSRKESNSSLTQGSNSLRKSFSKQSTSGQLSISSSRRQSSLAISFTPNTMDNRPPSIVSPAFSKLASPMSATSPNPNTSTQLNTITEPQSKAPDSSAEMLNEINLRRNLSTASASTSGDSSSTNPATRHANELEAVYSSFGMYSLSPPLSSKTEDADGLAEVVQGESGYEQDQSEVWDAEEWSKTHPILVRDFAFDEDDERFSKRPLELLLSSERKLEVSQPQSQSGSGSQGRRHRSSFGSRGPSRAPVGDLGYSGPDEEEWEDLDDGWGFPMGTVSGGGAPLGNSSTGTRRRQLKNKQRGWKNLGSQGIGGRYISEGESSEFYEESGEEDQEENRGFEGEEPMEEWQKPDALLDPRTPSYSYAQSPRFYNPDLELDGVEGDNDDSPHTFSPVSPDLAADSNSELTPGIYRALYSFRAEGANEMNLESGQLYRILGRGGGDGWAVALRHWTIEELIKGTREEAMGVGDGSNDEELQGLVPESYLEVYSLDDIP